jgi:DNA polymerase-3 subunit epsilon
MLQRWRHGRRCLKEARSCRQPELADYLRACAALDIGRIDSTPLIALDLELTGLDKRSERIVSMGWTLVDGGRIRLGSNRHLLIRSASPVGESALVHGVLDRELHGGATLEDGLQALFEAARGRLWVMHHAGLDIAFLKNACARWAGCTPGFIVLDTMRIEYQLRRRRQIPVRQGDLQLGRVRSLYELPAYVAHDALSDAVATAELMLAIAAAIEGEAALELAPWVKFF